MKTRKTLMGLLVAVLLVASMPASAALPPNFATRFVSGYYPSNVHTSAKYFECYLGGPRTAALAQLIYGTSSTPLRIDVTVCCYDPALQTGRTFDDYQIDYGTNSYIVTFNSSEIANGACVLDMRAIYKIGTAQMADLYTA